MMRYYISFCANSFLIQIDNNIQILCICINAVYKTSRPVEDNNNKDNNENNNDIIQRMQC